MCFFSKKYVGLDIADRSIEIAEVRSTFHKGKVTKLGRVSLEPGIVEHGVIKDADKLLLAIKELCKNTKPRPIKIKEVVFGIPESKVFIRHFYLGEHSRRERPELVKKEILSNLPIKESDLLFSFRILSEEKDKNEILAVATSRDFIREWLLFFQKAKIKVVSLDVEILASYRDLFSALQKEPVLVLDIGAVTSLVGIFDSRGMHYEYLINKAGNDFTSAIMEVSDMDTDKAELEKIKNGLKSKGKKITSALQKELDVIIKNIKQSLESFQQETGNGVSKIILLGGSARLSGIEDYFTEKLKIPVQIGSARSLNEKVPLEYVEAIGLALRNIEKNWDIHDPNIPIIN